MEPQVVEYYNKDSEIKITNYAEEQISKVALNDFEAIFDLYFAELILKYKCEIIVTRFSDRPVFAASVAIFQKNCNFIVIGHDSNCILEELILNAMKTGFGAIKLIQNTPGLMADNSGDGAGGDYSDLKDSPTAPKQQSNTSLPRLFNVDEVINSSIKYKKNPPPPQ